MNDPDTFERAEDLFKKFLIKSPCVELWAFYLTQVRYVGNLVYQSFWGLMATYSRLNVTPAQRDNIRISYEFALNHVGQDKDSGQIWSDYIQFLKSGEVRSCGTSL